jgi:hypothetical protein
MKTVLMFVLLLSTATLGAADVTGKWEGSLKWGDKSVPWYLTLKQDGETLSGKMGPAKEEDQRAIQDGKIEGSILHFRMPGGDGSGTEMLLVELKLENDELVGTIKGTGKDGTGQVQTYALSLKRAKTQ